jgi:hypothetical protein
MKPWRELNMPSDRTKFPLRVIRVGFGARLFDKIGVEHRYQAIVRAPNRHDAARVRSQNYED